MDTPREYEITYGVWIRGIGWLRKGERVFLDPRIELAQSAVRMWGEGASVRVCDEALVVLQPELLEREAIASKRRWWKLWRS